MRAARPESGDASVEGGVEHQEDSKLRTVAVPLRGHGLEGWQQPGETLVWLDPPETSGTGSASHYSRAGNRASMYFLLNNASSDTSKRAGEFHELRRHPCHPSPRCLGLAQPASTGLEGADVARAASKTSAVPGRG